MGKPNNDHEDTHLTFSQEHSDHDGGDGTHVDGYRYQAGSDKRDYEKSHEPVTPGYGDDEVDIPISNPGDSDARERRELMLKEANDRAREHRRKQRRGR